MKEPEVKFEKALAELKSIVEKLEKGDMELDESLKIFERGVRLVQVCTKKLDEAQRRVDIVMKSKDGKRTVEEFEEEGDEPDLDTEEEEGK